MLQAFALTFVSEIGDKTFFIAAILAAGSSAAEGLSQKAPHQWLEHRPEVVQGMWVESFDSMAGAVSIV